MMGNVGIKGHENIGGQYLKKKGIQFNSFFFFFCLNCIIDYNLIIS